MWKLGWPFGGSTELALHLVYTKLLDTNRILGGLLETPNTPLKNVQIQDFAIEEIQHSIVLLQQI